MAANPDKLKISPQEIAEASLLLTEPGKIIRKLRTNGVGSIGTAEARWYCGPGDEPISEGLRENFPPMAGGFQNMLMMLEKAFDQTAEATLTSSKRHRDNEELGAEIGSELTNEISDRNIGGPDVSGGRR